MKYPLAARPPKDVLEKPRGFLHNAYW